MWATRMYIIIDLSNLRETERERERERERNRQTDRQTDREFELESFILHGN